MLARRSRAREVALQLLVQHDFNPKVARPVIDAFVRARLSDRDLERYCASLYDGVLGHLDQIDTRLGSVSQNWRLPRMAAVDRNVLRLGLFELALMADPPPAAVVLNESVELAKRYGSKDSPAFVNGILDRFHKPAASPAGAGAQ